MPLADKNEENIRVSTSNRILDITVSLLQRIGAVNSRTQAGRQVSAYTVWQRMLAGRQGSMITVAVPANNGRQVRSS